MKAAPMGKKVKSSNLGEGLQHNKRHRPIGPREKEAQLLPAGEGEKKTKATTKISK